jgi:hypothetical protein
MKNAIRFLRRRGCVVRPFWTPHGWRYEVSNYANLFIS